MSWKEVQMPPMMNISSTQYTIVPPSRFLSWDSENKDDAVMGANIRIEQATVCARPLTAPSEDFVGAAWLKSTNTAP